MFNLNAKAVCVVFVKYFDKSSLISASCVSEISIVFWFCSISDLFEGVFNCSIWFSEEATFEES